MAGEPSVAGCASGIVRGSGLEVLGRSLVGADQVVVDAAERACGDARKRLLQVLPDPAPDAADGVVEQGPEHGPGPPGHPCHDAPLVVPSRGDDGCAHLRAAQLSAELSLHFIG